MCDFGHNNKMAAVTTECAKPKDIERQKSRKVGDAYLVDRWKLIPEGNVYSY